ncbi:MAG: hypothetical protein WCA89_13565 [Terracidiphilus sp.]|jgi:hypothetical protein
MTKVNDYMLKVDRDKKFAAFEKRCQAWDKTRKRGMLFFVIFRGARVLIFFVSLFLFYACMDAIVFRGHPDKILPPLVIGAITFFLFGIVFGVLEWYKNERRYGQKMKQ